MTGYVVLAGTVATGAAYAGVSAKAGEDYSPFEITAVMSFSGALWFDALNFDSEEILFEGKASDAVKEFPLNINVAATIFPTAWSCPRAN